VLCSKLQRPQHTHLGGTRDGQGDLTGSTRKQPVFAKRSGGRAGGIVDSVLGQLLSLLSCALAPSPSLSASVSLSLSPKLAHSRRSALAIRDARHSIAVSKLSAVKTHGLRERGAFRRRKMRSIWRSVQGEGAPGGDGRAGGHQLGIQCGSGGH
jgi:hypothetical protein